MIRRAITATFWLSIAGVLVVSCGEKNIKRNYKPAVDDTSQTGKKPDENAESTPVTLSGSPNSSTPVDTLSKPTDPQKLTLNFYTNSQAGLKPRENKFVMQKDFVFELAQTATFVIEKGYSNGNCGSDEGATWKVLENVDATTTVAIAIMVYDNKTFPPKTSFDKNIPAGKYILRQEVTMPVTCDFLLLRFYRKGL